MKWYKYPITQDMDIKFRTLSAEETDRLYKPAMSENPMADEFIFNLITENQYDIDEINAGIIPTVIFCAFKLSGFYSKQEDLIDAIESARKQYENNVYHQLFYSKISRIMPGVYKLEDLKTKSLNELLELYVLAETILGSNIHDTKKMRESIKEGPQQKGKKSKSKVLNMITPEMLQGLKASLQAEELDGMPLDTR